MFAAIPFIQKIRLLLAMLACLLSAPALAAFTNNGDGTVTDTATGLMWQRCAKGQSWTGSTCSGSATAYTWNQAVALTDSFAGHTDWRLPSLTELQSLVKLGSVPTIDTTAFPATSPVGFWSSTANTSVPANAWYVNFNVGFSVVGDKTSGVYVRLVRVAAPVSGTAPTDMVAYYCFDDPANIGKDCSVNGNNGTASGGVSAAPGVQGGGALFGGFNKPGAIRVPNSASLKFGTNSSLSFFIKIDSPAGMNGNGSLAPNGIFAVVAKSHDRTGLIWNASIDATNKLSSGFGGFSGVTTSGTAVLNGWATGATGRWVHVVHVVDNVGLKTYLDGRLAWSQSGSVNFGAANTQDMYIGKFSDSWYPLNGTLDELKIFNRALSAGEVQALSATGGGVQPTTTTVTPNAARLDVLQTFTLAGTGFSAGTTVAVADCTNDASFVPTPANTSTSITFRCTPTLPGNKTVSVNGTVVPGFTVNIDHPARLGNAAARGIPAVNGVSLWNGNVHLEATDLAVPGKGVSFALTRSYNSYSWDYEAARGSVSNLAPWRFNWDLKLGYVGGNNKRMWVQREDGSGENFFKDTDNLWYPMDQGNFNTLKSDTPVAGQTTLLTREGLKYVFESPDQMSPNKGLLVGIFDHDGNGLTIRRIGGFVATVTDASNRVYTFTYDANYNLSRVTDFTGRYVEYTWDVGVSSRRIKTVRDVRGGITTYNYSVPTPTLASPPAPQTLLTSIVDPLGNTVSTFTYTDTVYGNWGASSVKDALNNMWRYSYCAKQSNGSCSTDPTAAVSFETTTTPPLGAVTVARFDTGGRLIEQVDANLKLSKITPTPLTGLTSKTYNLAALPTQKQSALGVTGSYATRYTYTPDSAGNLATLTDAENATTNRTWLGSAALVAINLHRVAQFASATGANHNFAYTSSGNVQTYTPPGLPAIALAYDAAGQVTGVTDGRNNTSSRVYDANGNLTKVTGPDTFFEQNTYDNLGRALTSTDKRGNLTTNTWDAAGNLLTVKDALNGTVSYGYDANGNRTQMTDARGNVIHHTYDANNRLKTVGKVSGAQTLTTTYNYDALGRTTSTVNANSHADSTTYDGEGNVLASANALAHTTQYVYDADNRVTKTTDPEGRVTDTSYDKVGRVKTVTTAAGITSYVYDGDGRMTSSTDPRGKITGYAYDAAGRLTALTDANSQVTRATYDANGNMLTVVDPNGKTTRYTYDTLNRPLTRTDANGQQWVTTYDQNGNIRTSTVPGNKTTTYTYDALDRVSRIDYPDASVVTYSYDANGNRLTMADSTGTTRYTYDALDRMTGKTDPQGKTVSYSYDGIGNVTTLGYPGGQSVSYGYDAGERLTSLTDWLGKTTAYTLNRAGQVTAALFGNNSRADMGYDAAGRMTSLTNKKADGSVISSHVMTLDANGNITSATQQLPLQPSLSNFNRAFTYDPANRLATYNGAAVSHDTAGRITGLSGASYSYNDRDQIAAITGSQTASYAYNGEGHRVMRNVNGAITRFVIDPNRGLPEVVAETSDVGAVQRNYVYGYGLVEQIDSANAASYYHYDPTGSTLALTNAAGAVSDSYAYTPYGETTVSGSTVNPFRYVGKLGVMDDGNGMQYMRARYYRPEVARFMSLDQLAGSADKPQSLNRYAYVLGNPVMGVDPSGLVPSGVASMNTAERKEWIRKRAEKKLLEDQFLSYGRSDAAGMLNAFAETKGVSITGKSIKGFLFGIKDMLIGKIKETTYDLVIDELVRGNKIDKNDADVIKGFIKVRMNLFPDEKDVSKFYSDLENSSFSAIYHPSQKQIETAATNLNNNLFSLSGSKFNPLCQINRLLYGDVCN